MADLDNTTPDLAVAASIVQAHHAQRQTSDPVYAAKFASAFVGESIFDNPQSVLEGVTDSVFDTPNEPADVMMAENTNVVAGVVDEPDPVKAVPDNVVDVDGITIEEFSVPPPPLPRKAVRASSHQLPTLHAADLPMPKARPPLIQCDRCRKWRQIDGSINGLPSQWTCPDQGCDDEEDYWGSKLHRIIPYRRLSLPTPEQELQQQEELKKIQSILPQLPQQSRTYSYPDNDEPNSHPSVESIFWIVPKPFIETDERKEWYKTLQNKLLQKGQLTRSFPKIGPLKQPVDLYALFQAVQDLSSTATSMNDIWVQAAAQLNLEVTPTALRACYMRFLQHLTPIRNMTMRPDGTFTPAKRGRPSTSLSSPSFVNNSNNNVDVSQFHELLSSLTERVSTLEQIVGKLVNAQQATSLEALQSIKNRVVELSENVHQSNVIMQELLPVYKEPPRDL